MKTYVTTCKCADGTYDGAAWMRDGDHCIDIIVGLATRSKARTAAKRVARKVEG